MDENLDRIGNEYKCVLCDTYAEIQFLENTEAGLAHPLCIFRNQHYKEEMRAKRERERKAHLKIKNFWVK